MAAPRDPRDPLELPRTLLGLAGRTARTGVTTGVKVASWYERQVFGILRNRLEASVPPPTREIAPPAQREGLDLKMGRLLDRALEQSTSSSRQELFHKILDQIVPDEARIIGALSDGSHSPVVHVYGRTRAGLVGDTLIENASLVGKTANLALPHLTPTYVSHLLALGLVELGPEDPELKDEYQILGADTAVLRAIKAGSRGMIPPRIEKATLKLSGLGRELWAATSGQR